MTTKLIEEWAPQQAVLMSWPHQGTDWYYMLPEVQSCFLTIADAIMQRAHLVVVAPDAADAEDALGTVADPDRFTVVEMLTNDTWARDFGPLTVGNTNGSLHLLDYQFNGWGLKFAAGEDNQVNRHLNETNIFAAKMVSHLDFVLEGGSIDIDSDGTLLTTAECLLSSNRNPMLTRQQIEKKLICDLGAKRVIWLENGFLEGDDTDSHVDTLARFLPGGIIAYSACDRPNDLHYKPLKHMEEELQQLNEYKLVALPIPESIFDEDRQLLPATYANFLLLNGALLLPVYGDQHYDSIAIARLHEALPEYEIVPIDCTALIKQHGSLHCMTMQMPFGTLRLPHR